MKIRVDTVDEYGKVIDNLDNFGGYLFTVANGSVVTYLRQAGSGLNGLNFSNTVKWI